MSANDLLARFAPRNDMSAKAPASNSFVEPAEHEEAPGDAFRCMRGGHKAVGLRYIFQGGGDVTMPYGYLPSTWKGPENSILIEYPQFTVHLAGRNLDQLRARVDEQRVFQIRELDDLQAKSLAIVVTRIQIVGWFPSKQVLSLGRVSGQWPQPASTDNRVPPKLAPAHDQRLTAAGRG
jgi:hypothetical protein